MRERAGAIQGTRALRLLCGFCLAAALSACGGGHRIDRDIYGPGPGGSYRVGNPYSVNGIWYYPAENQRYSTIGMASWYGREFRGNSTANGERFDPRRLTAAHTTLPMPVLVRVTNLQNNRSVVLRVNDRGPFVPGRVIDVSEAAAEELGFRVQGTTQVRIDYVGRADGQDTPTQALPDPQPLPNSQPVPDTTPPVSDPQPLTGSQPLAIAPVPDAVTN